MQIKIRKPYLEDKESILKLVKRFYGKSAPKCVSLWKRSYKKLIETTLIAGINKKIIGFVNYAKQKNSLCIHDLYVSPKYRRKGVATSFFKKIEKIKKQLGKKHLRVNNRKKDRAAFKLYTKLRFKIEKNKRSRRLIK